MNTVRIPCPRCGPRNVPASDVRLWAGPNGGSYLFVCRCGGRFYRHCGARIRDALAEVCETVRVVPERMSGPPISPTDWFDFLVALDDEGWVDELA